MAAHWVHVPLSVDGQKHFAAVDLGLALWVPYPLRTLTILRNSSGARLVHWESNLLAANLPVVRNGGQGYTGSGWGDLGALAPPPPRPPKMVSSFRGMEVPKSKRDCFVGQNIGHPISCLGVCCANDPQKQGCMASLPALDLRTSLRGNLGNTTQNIMPNRSQLCAHNRLVFAFIIMHMLPDMCICVLDSRILDQQ